MTDKVVVLVTTSGIKESRRIANALVDTRLAACVNVVPKLTSYYRWKGEVECNDECLLIVKSCRQHFDELRKLVEKLHSYKVPEIICLQIVEGADPYMDWLEESLAPPPHPLAVPAEPRAVPAKPRALPVKPRALPVRPRGVRTPGRK